MIIKPTGIIPDHPHPQKPHRSHKMTPWESEVLRSYQGPAIYQARQCEFCHGIQAKNDRMTLMHDRLRKRCTGYRNGRMSK